MAKPKDVPPAPEGALSRDALFTAAAAIKPATERVPCPELKGYVVIAELTPDRRDLWEKETAKKGDTDDHKVGIRAKAIALALWDETTGDWMGSLADVPVIGTWPGKVAQRCFEAFVRVNALRNEDLAELEAALKNVLSAAG